MQDDLKQYLTDQPLARERKNKNRAIGNLVIQRYKIEIDKGKMEDIVGEILSADRQWRKILEENPELRGQDWADKFHLEVEKQRQLGYNI